MITKHQVLQAQQNWAEGIVKIGELKNDRIECEKFANNFISKVYAFDFCEVLFKPTKVSKNQFRTNKISALSYFIGGNNDFEEDKGFAINPWKEVIFDENFYMISEEKRAITMGNYYFVDTSNNKVKVEYTFGYKAVENNLKIDLHHSSLPFNS